MEYRMNLGKVTWDRFTYKSPSEDVSFKLRHKAERGAGFERSILHRVIACEEAWRKEHGWKTWGSDPQNCYWSRLWEKQMENETGWLMFRWVWTLQTMFRRRAFILNAKNILWRVLSRWGSDWSELCFKLILNVCKVHWQEWKLGDQLGGKMRPKRKMSSVWQL